MNDLIINNPKNVFDPKINFSIKEKHGTITGESFMENAVKFYQPVIDWLKEYFDNYDEFKIEIALNYFNTSSSKMIYKLFEFLKDYEKDGRNITVIWKMSEEDDGLEDDIDEMKVDTGLDITMIKEDEEE